MKRLCIELLGDKDALNRFVEGLHDFAKDFAQVVMDDCAWLLKEEINKQFRERKEPALHPLTIALRAETPGDHNLLGADMPLVNTANLLDSFKVYEVSWDTYEIGVKEGQPRPDNKEALPIAVAMENGAMFRVTEKMRALFAAKGYPLRKFTEAIVVPARPFLRPAKDAGIVPVATFAQEKLLKMVMERLAA